MSITLEIDLYEDYGERSTPSRPRKRKATHSTTSYPDINKDYKKNTYQYLLKRQLQQFPEEKVTSIMNEALPTIKQQYISWVNLSITHQQPMIDPDRDFLVEYAPDPKANGNYRMIHTISGIRVRFENPEDSEELLQTKVRLYGQLEKHIDYWHELRKLNGIDFNVETILAGLLPNQTSGSKPLPPHV